LALNLAENYKFSYGAPDPMDANLQKGEGFSEEQFDRDLFIEQILHDGYIMLSIPPISSGMSIDKIRQIYAEFPFIKKYCPVTVPILDSNNKYRMIYTRRPIVIGYKYIFRLKQLSEEKFSAVSLASTNIRNENSKSKLAKSHNARYPSTPVRVYGEMESSTISSHVGPEVFIEEFALNSSSPEARRSNEELLTGDPFSFNIELDEDCISQSADIVQAFLKVFGQKLTFSKIRKFKPKPALRIIATKEPVRAKNIYFKVPDELWKTRDIDSKIPKAEKKAIDKFTAKMEKEEQKREGKPLKQIYTIDVGVKEYNKQYDEYCNKLRSIGIDPKDTIRSKY
jgi:hypothetical protein